MVDKEPLFKNSKLWENRYTKVFNKPDNPCHLSNDNNTMSDFVKRKRKAEFDSSWLNKQITFEECKQ